MKESFEIAKTTDYNDVRYTDGQNIRFGLMATKVVLDPDKDYGDLRIIDLYDPNTLKVDYKDFERNLASNEKGMKFLKSYDVIENYHNSGRTALIMHLDQKEFIKASLQDLNRVRLPFIVADLKGKDDGGTFTNKVYVAGNGIHDLENANPDRVTEDVYDLNGNGSTTDKIPYAQSNYTIVAAEGIYARKYIAKNDDLSDASIVTRTFKPGETFNYKLTIKNNTDKAVEDGVVYDVLPKVKDVNTLDGSGRMTEYTVSLRGPVTAPEGWTVYYTTDTGVTTDTMAQAADKDIWTTAVTDYSQVTGIKLVANAGTTIPARGEASFGVPVVNPSELTDEVKALMQKRTKDNEDNGGRSGLVQAHNQFGYKAKGHEGNRESNTVTAQIFSAAFHVKKVDKDDPKKVLEGAEFTLTDANGAVVATATSDKKGELAFNTLTEGTYTLKETKAPANYKLDETEHAVVVTYDADKQIYHVTVDGKAVGSKAVPVEIANEADIKYIDLEASKVWDDQDNQDGLRPKTIKVQLYAGDQKVGKAVELSADNKWTHTFSNLDEKKAGQVINYTVKEIDVPEGYTQAVEATNPGQVVVTNTHEPEKTKVEVSKKWEDGDDQDGLRPASIQVQLYKDGLPTDQVLELSAANDWKGAFENLDAKAAGKAIAYTVKEVTVPDGYKVTVNDKDKANVVLTNTHEPALTEMKVTKKWEDANNQDGLRPKSIKVQLYAGDEKVGDPVELSADNQWTHTFTKLAEKKAGQAISYRVEEVDVPKDYQVSADTSDAAHTILTNTHTPAVIDIPVTKIWNDHDNQDGLRPDRIVVHLLANGDPVAQKELTNATDWKENFTGLPKFKDGKEIVYTLQEEKVAEYTTTIDQAAYTITNTHAPGKTSVTVTKKWDDENDKDGIRPKSIRVQLYANDQKVGQEVELSAENKWTHTFADLDEKANGNTITYTVREVSVPKGYEARNDEDGKGNVVITNKHVPKETPKQPTPPSSSEPKKPGQPEPKKPSQPEPKKPGKILGFLPNTGTTISIISLVLAFVLASIAAYILKKKKK
ncbi:Cna B-type domain-containing protein [Streptococcus parasanguinis]|uniref:Cna B-type domain-containing protein n=1 Tax=Streptococcus parasanguinis TaxID=1318 RepID=UPI0020008D29|nr:Cna B-type domain-containing protein [Streptococcus parasanguinis]